MIEIILSNKYDDELARFRGFVQQYRAQFLIDKLKNIDYILPYVFVLFDLPCTKHIFLAINIL